MTMVNRTICIAAILLVAVVLPTHAAEYKGLGVSRDAVNTMLHEEGLNPTFNKFPDIDGLEPLHRHSDDWPGRRIDRVHFDCTAIHE